MNTHTQIHSYKIHSYIHTYSFLLGIWQTFHVRPTRKTGSMRTQNDQIEKSPTDNKANPSPHEDVGKGNICMYVCVCVCVHMCMYQVQVFTQRPCIGRIKICNCANREVQLMVMYMYIYVYVYVCIYIYIYIYI